MEVVQNQIFHTEIFCLFLENFWEAVMNLGVWMLRESIHELEAKAVLTYKLWLTPRSWFQSDITKLAPNLMPNGFFI